MTLIFLMTKKNSEAHSLTMASGIVDQTLRLIYELAAADAVGTLKKVRAAASGII